MLLRVESAEGTRRVEVAGSDSTMDLFEKVREAFALDSYTFSLHQSRNKTQEIISSRSRTLAGYGLNHGDRIFMSVIASSTSDNSSVPLTSSIVQPTTTPVLSTQTSKAPVRSAVPEDEADVLLQKMDGMIPRKKDIKLCQHVGDNSSCIHCLPLEPYDPTYLEQHNIKHMSFHSYLRKMSSGYGSGKFADLDNISCRIKADCTAHPPWPRGVCSKCQPKAITLNRQVYRHVDNVMFENPNLVERFLHYWRVTGRQRVGLLYGRYEVHLDVPLGIKAVVSAIYEPPQESTRDSVQLLDDPNGELVKSISSKLGMSEIGWMFTDLVAEDAAKGTVRHFRHAATHFLSAQECIMAGHFQSTHPNACRNSSSGYMGSKFVTVCVTGDSQHQVHMEGYQVSNQCEALVRDGCLVPTKDAPELGFIRQSSAQMYVPDVFYKEKDTYGNEVTRLARPLPVEYLLVDVPVSTPLEPLFTFYAGPEKSFPVENRPIDGHLQDLSSLATYLNAFPRHRFLDAASDLHFLIYIATMDVLPLFDCMDPLLEAVRTRDAGLAARWASQDQWGTVEQLLAHANEVGGIGDVGRSMPDLDDMAPRAGARTWTCQHCTYINRGALNSCEICNLPHQG